MEPTVWVKVSTVRVMFGQAELRFPSGVTVQQANQMIAASNASRHGKLAMEAIVNGSPLSLPDGFRLEDLAGWEYRVKAFVYRRFGAGHGIRDPKEYYYVQPVEARDIDGLLTDLSKGKYCVVCDRRQSGKTTMVHAVARRLEQEGAAAIYVGGLVGPRLRWDGPTMWKRLCLEMHWACPALFRKPGDTEECSAKTFRGYLHTKQINRKVLLILDEAESLLNLSSGYLDELFCTITNMKSQRNLYNLWAFLLVGVETVKNLLEGQPSRLVPFPHDLTISVAAFELEDIVALMDQANKEHDCRISDIEMTATSIWQLTAGHKGLVGTCLAFMVQEEAFTHKAWLELVDSYKLGSHIFGQATYSRMMKYLGKQSQKLYELLTYFLTAEELRFESLVHLRNLLAEGVLVSREENNGYVVKMSSPLLRTAILRRCSIVEQQVDSPPNPNLVDRTWALCEAIRRLDGETMCRPEHSGASSEYAHQFAFMCRIKAVLQVAYPFVGAVVLPEVRELPVDGYKRSKLQLDTLVDDHQHFHRFGFECLVDGTGEVLKAHYDKAVKYSRQHSAQMYLVHFAMGKDPLPIVPRDDSVYFWGVRFDPGQQKAWVCTLDATGAEEYFGLELKNWTGKLNFKGIV